MVVSFDLVRPMFADRTRRQKLLEKIAMLKPQTNGVKGLGKLCLDDPEAFKDVPYFRGFLLDQSYGLDEDQRQGGVVIFKASGDGWQFTLKDPSSCQMLRVTGRTLAETMLLLDRLIASPDAPWETDSYEAGKRGRSRGKKT